MKLLFLSCFLIIGSLYAFKLDQDEVSAVMRSINSAAREKGGVYSEYSCKTVSWDDGDRGTVDGELSVWGASITDTRLWAKDGQLLFTVRSDNWNEKLGTVKASDIKLVVGNDKPGGNLRTITLREFLKDAGTFGGYAGIPAGKSLLNADADDKVSIRFQTTFLPVEDKEKATLEFATEAYNYNTRSDDDPKNIVVLATTQGIAVQQDGEGAKKVYHHEVDDSGVIHRYWLEAERTKHKVGGAQNETTQERIDAKKRGKALAREIGIPAMGKRFNVLMTVQVPLKQEPQNFTNAWGILGPGVLEDGGPVYFELLPQSVSFGGGFGGQWSRGSTEEKRKEGESNAARVSRGSEVDTWDGLTVEDPTRHPTQHVTVTIVLYNTIAGGVPKVEDVVAAIDDMEALYKSADWSGNLIDKEADFMKTELTNNTLGGIWAKITEQPYTLNPLEPIILEDIINGTLIDRGVKEYNSTSEFN